MPSVEENTRLAEEFIEKVFNQHDVGYLKDALSEDFVDLSPAPGETGDRAGAIAWFEQLLHNMPDTHAEVIQTIASGDKVAIRGRYTGTDDGGFMPGMEPTHKTVTMESIDIVQIGDDAKHLSHFGIQDTMSVMGQLGLLPPPADG
jgi:predicted ester cyclase